MRVHIYGLMMLLGLILAVQLSMNAKAGALINNPRDGNGLFWLVAALTALVIGSHFDWLGSPVQPITLTRLGGVVVRIAGAAIISFVN